MRSIILGAALSTLLACSDLAPHFVPLPDFSREAQSIVIASEVDGEVLVDAFELDDWVFSHRTSADPRVLHLLLYRETLAELGFLAGSLVRATSEDCGRRNLSPPLERFVLDPASASSAFVPASGLPATLSDLSFAGACPCRSFDRTVVDLGWGGWGRDIEFHGDGFRLLTHVGLFELSSALEVLTSSVGILPRDMYTDAEGTSWVVADEGRLFRWLAAGDPQLVGVHPEAGELSRVGPFAVGREHLVLGEGGLYRWTEERFENLHSGVEGPDSDQLSVLATLPSGRTLVGLYRRENFLLVTPGADAPETLPWGSTLNPPQRLDFVPAVGTVLGTRTSRVYVSKDEGSSWSEITPVGTDRLLLGTLQFLPYGDGFLELGTKGVRQYDRFSGYCPSVTWSDAPQFHGGVALDDGGAILLGRTPAGYPERSTVLHVIRPRAAPR